MQNIPEVKLGLIAVSRDCFPVTLSVSRREAIKSAYKGELYECPVAGQGTGSHMPQQR